MKLCDISKQIIIILIIKSFNFIMKRLFSSALPDTTVVVLINGVSHVNGLLFGINEISYLSFMHIILQMYSMDHLV